MFSAPDPLQIRPKTGSTSYSFLCILASERDSLTHHLLSILINLVVFASGSGTNFQALIDAAEDNRLNSKVRGLIVNNPDAGAIGRAQKHHIEYATLTPSQFSNPEKYNRQLLTQLQEWKTDLIALAGYLLKIPAEVIGEYEGRIINIHPALLPQYGGKGFYGMNVHKAVVENQEQESGCTVHLVTEEYDKGPILGQRKVPVHATDDPDSLSKRILAMEHELYPKVIARLAKQLQSKKTS